MAVDPHVGLSDADFDLLTLFEDGRQQEAHFGEGGNGEDYEEGGELGWMMSPAAAYRVGPGTYCLPRHPHCRPSFLE